MNYKDRATSRKIKRFFTRFLEKSFMRIKSFEVADLFIGIGLSFGIASFFYPLFLNSTNSTNFYMHSKLTIIPGLYFLMFYIYSILALLSLKNKNAIRNFLGLKISDKKFLLYGSTIGIFINFQILLSINFLQLLVQNIKIGDGLIYTFVSTILLFIGGILSKNIKKAYIGINLETSKDEEKIMKLPI